MRKAFMNPTQGEKGVDLEESLYKHALRCVDKRSMSRDCYRSAETSGQSG